MLGDKCCRCHGKQRFWPLLSCFYVTWVCPLSSGQYLTLCVDHLGSSSFFLVQSVSSAQSVSVSQRNNTCGEEHTIQCVAPVSEITNNNDATITLYPVKVKLDRIIFFLASSSAFFLASSSSFLAFSSWWKKIHHGTLNHSSERCFC